MFLKRGVPASIRMGDLHMPAVRKGDSIYPIGDGRRLMLTGTEEGALLMARTGIRKARRLRVMRVALMLLIVLLLIRISWSVSRLTYEPPVLPLPSVAGVMV